MHRCIDVCNRNSHSSLYSPSTILSPRNINDTKIEFTKRTPQVPLPLPHPPSPPLHLIPTVPPLQSSRNQAFSSGNFPSNFRIISNSSALIVRSTPGAATSPVTTPRATSKAIPTRPFVWYHCQFPRLVISREGDDDRDGTDVSDFRRDYFDEGAARIIVISRVNFIA